MVDGSSPPEISKSSRSKMPIKRSGDWDLIDQDIKKEIKREKDQPRREIERETDNGRERSPVHIPFTLTL